MPTKARSRRRLLGLLIRGLVTLAIIAFLFYKFDWTELLLQLRRADYRWLALACLLFGITYCLAALRWWLLLQVQAIVVHWRVIAALTLVGQFFNAFMLGSVGGDIVKALYLHRYAPQQRTHATLSVVIDRALGLFVLLCGSLLALPWLIRSMLQSQQAEAAIVGISVAFAVLVAGAAAMAWVPFRRAPQILHRLWVKIPQRRVLELLVSGFRQHGVALRWTLASVAAAVAVMLVLNLAALCIAIGIGLDVTYLQLLVIMTIAICVTSLPISIGGHGVREGIFLLMFASFGIVSAEQGAAGGQETAILFSLLFFAVPLLWSFAGGIVYLTFRHDYPDVKAQGDAGNAD